MTAPCSTRRGTPRRRFPFALSPFALSSTGALLLSACGGGGGGGEPPDLKPPTLRFDSFQSDQRVVQSGDVTVAWTADDPDDEATVSIFADADGEVGTTTDRHTLIDEVPEENGARREETVELRQVPDGDYTLLGRIRDGKGGEEYVAAPGKLIIENRALVAPLAGSELRVAAHLPRPDGSFDVLGMFRGLVTFDPRHRLQSTGRSWDLFVARFTPQGVIRWLSIFESTGDMESSAFVRAPNGDLLLAGAFAGTLSLPDGSDVRSRNSDVFLARLSEAGEPRWVRTASSPNRDIAEDITLLDDGTFAVAGTFNIGDTTYGIDFGEDRSGRSVSLPSAGGADGFVTRYASDGVPLWARSVGSPANDGAHAAAVLDGDRILSGGAFADTATFGEGAEQRTATGDTDGYLAEWQPDGTLARVETFVGSADETVVALTRRADGDLIVLANSTSQMLDVAGRGTAQLAAGMDAALACFAPDDSVRWTIGAAVGPGDCQGTSVVTREDDSMLVAGTYADGARFAPGGPAREAAGPVDGFVTQRAADGSLQWMHRFSSPGADGDLAVSAGADGTTLVTGHRGNGDLRVVTANADETLAASPESTDFIARFHPDGELGRGDVSRRIGNPATIQRGNVSLQVQGLHATLDGFDDTETTAAIRQLLDEHPAVGLLVVERANGPSEGRAHLEAARLLAAEGIETHIPFNGSMYGGGIDLFLGGRRRTAGDGAVIGVRSWIDPGGFSGYQVRDDRSHPAHQPYLDFYDGLGVPRDYYWASIGTPRNQFRPLTRTELEQYGVVTD